MQDVELHNNNLWAIIVKITAGFTFLFLCKRTCITHPILRLCKHDLVNVQYEKVLCGFAVETFTHARIFRDAFENQRCKYCAT